MREIRLYGHLGDRFGRVFHFDVASPAEAIAALRANLEGFEQYMLEHSKPGYKVFIGALNAGKEHLRMISRNSTIRIVPVIAGAGGIVRVIIGAILIAASFIPGFQFLAPIGISMVIGGVAELLFAPPSAKVSEKADNQPSYSFNGPVNTTKQGNAIPLAYGQLIIGSQVIYAGIAAEEAPIINHVNPTYTPAVITPSTAQVTAISSTGNNESKTIINSISLINSKTYFGTWSGASSGLQVQYQFTYDSSIGGFYINGNIVAPTDLPIVGTVIAITENATAPWQDTSTG